MIVKAFYKGAVPVLRIYHGGVCIYRRRASQWCYPARNGTVLRVEQVYGAVPNGGVLEVE